MISLRITAKHLPFTPVTRVQIPVGTQRLRARRKSRVRHCVGFVPPIDPDPAFVPLKPVLGLGLLGYVAIMVALMAGCGDLPHEVPEVVEPTCSGSWVTVCNPACDVVCFPRLSPEAIEACEPGCRELHQVQADINQCVWDCVERWNDALEALEAEET